jgi:hypothetical protein
MAAIMKVVYIMSWTGAVDFHRQTKFSGSLIVVFVGNFFLNVWYF